MLLYKWHNILKLKLSGSCCVMSLRHSSSPGSWSFHFLETPLPQETSPGSNSHLLHRILKVTLIFASNPIFLCLLLWTWLFLNPALQAETLTTGIKHPHEMYPRFSWEIHGSQILISFAKHCIFMVNHSSSSWEYSLDQWSQDISWHPLSAPYPNHLVGETGPYFSMV